MESPAAWKVSAYVGSNLIKVIDWAFSHFCRILWNFLIKQKKLELNTEHSFLSYINGSVGSLKTNFSFPPALVTAR